MRTQAAITKHLKHRNLVTLYEVIDDPSHHTLYLVLEYCERGPLLKRGRDTPYEPISEADNRRATRDVLRGLEYLHSVNVVHRDVACGVHGAFTMTTPCRWLGAPDVVRLGKHVLTHRSSPRTS